MEQPLCRTCLAPAFESIFKTVFLDQNKLSLVEMLFECTGLKVTDIDELSTKVCDNCIEEIIKSYVFRQKCWNSQNFLLQQLEESKTTSEVIIIIADEFSETEQLLEPNEENVDSDLLKKTKLTVKRVSTSKSIKCDMCDKIVSSRRTMITHLRKVHNKFENFYNCDFCDKSFLRLINLGRHISRVHQHSDNEKLDSLISKNTKPTGNIVPKISHSGVKCKLCDKIYYRRYSMLDHLRIVHNIPKNHKFECKTCTKTFYRLGSLKRHVNKFHKPKQPKADVEKFICHHCGHIVKNRQNFNEHVRTHTGEKPYKCNVCDYRAGSRTSVTIHKRIHTGERPFKCDICGQLFRTSSGRSHHLRSHSDEKPYECIVCSKKFKQRDIFKEHMLIHDPDKYIDCKYCGKKFARKDNLKTHLKQHTGEKPHVCEVCGKGFIQKHCWRNHMKNHHKQ